jgi:hypothetical protein
MKLFINALAMTIAFPTAAFAGDAAMHAVTLAIADCAVTMAQYSAIKPRMSKGDVVSILGCTGTEISSGDMAGIRTEMISWKGSSLGANMNAMFQNNRLISKAQFGLE